MFWLCLKFDQADRKVTGIDLSDRRNFKVYEKSVWLLIYMNFK